MLTFEYRIPMPMHLTDYERAHLYVIMEVSKELSGGGEGVEVVANEPFEGSMYQQDLPGYVFANSPFEKGQYTHKVIHVQELVPRVMRALAPKGSLELHEKSQNSFPNCTTVVSNPDYMKDGFYVIIETVNVDGDRGESDNIFNLDSDLLTKRQVVTLDIANNKFVEPRDYKEKEDPTKYSSTKTAQVPLIAGWIESSDPVMCSYKRVTINFQWRGLTDSMEKRINSSIARALLKVHRCVFCFTDQWYDLTMADIRTMEEKTKHELDKLRQQGSVTALMGSSAI